MLSSLANGIVHYNLHHWGNVKRFTIHIALSNFMCRSIDKNFLWCNNLTTDKRIDDLTDHIITSDNSENIIFLVSI